MPHVAIGGKLHQSGLDLLISAPGYSIDYTEEVSTHSLLPMLPGADALLIRTQPLPARFIEQARNLKIVSRHGVGFDAVDISALNARNIPLSIVGDVNSRTVAEHTMTLILGTIKRLLRYDAASRGLREWNYRNSLEAEEITDKFLLIVGYGRIGRQLSEMAQAFGMNVIVYDPYLKSNQDIDNSIRLESNLGDALQVADVVSIHVPGTDKPIIGATELALMKPTAVVINTARGGLVDEQALAVALESNQIAGAGIDVFDTEPPPSNHPLFNFDQVILTPHSAGMTLQCAERMAVSSAENIIDFFNGSLDSDLVVNASEIAYAQPHAELS